METLIILVLAMIVFNYIMKSKKGNIKKKTNLKLIESNRIDWVWDENSKKFVPFKDGKRCSAEDSSSQSDAEESEEIDYHHAYQARLLLSKNEWHAFKKLQEITKGKNYMICPKVRLLDIIEPIRGQKKYKTLIYKIQSKHVDFVVCDENVHIKAIIELDDGSHDREDRKERDQFVDEILTSVGYKVIHTRAILPDILDQI